MNKLYSLALIAILMVTMSFKDRPVSDTPERSSFELATFEANSAEINNMIQEVMKTQGFFRHEEIVWRAQLVADDLTLKAVPFSSQSPLSGCVEVITGEGQNPCTYPSRYMYCDAAPHWRCCWIQGCWEAPAPY